MAVVVTWTLKEKNGIIKEYHVTYMREDDNSETKTLATKKMEARFDLKAGKTYKLQVETFYYLSEVISVYNLFQKKSLFKATKEQSIKYLRINETLKVHEVQVIVKHTMAEKERLTLAPQEDAIFCALEEQSSLMNTMISLP